MIERVHGKMLGQGPNVTAPMLPTAHTAVKEYEIRSTAALVHGYHRRAIRRHVVLRLHISILVLRTANQ
jgi:hypothetical protein